MAVRRKVFRIEESAYHWARRPLWAHAPNGGSPDMPRIAPDPSEQDTANVDCELAAIVADAERSANTILQAVEDIDCRAAELSVIAGCARERELAKDIRCYVGQILEACGFHDLTGQRIAKVQSALAGLEGAPATLSGGAGGLPGSERRMLNGPKAEGDAGHCSQDDIDFVFGRP